MGSYYVIAAWDFVSYLYPCILCQILVFIHQFFRVPLLMVLHLSPFSLILSDIVQYLTILSGGFVPLCVIPSVHQGEHKKL